ncbi:hypothetical protein BH11PLA1_BH11PLA1_07970 [soil metagenome]
MSDRADKLMWCPPAIMRLCVLAGAGVLFFGVSMVLKPESSRASTLTNRAEFPAQRADALLDPNAESGAPFVARTGGRGEGAGASGKLARVLDPMRPPVQDEQGHLLLGMLKGPESAVVWVYSGPSGPLYTALEPGKGVTAWSLESDDFYQRFPQFHAQDIKLMPFDINSGAIMLAEPEKQQLP